MIRRIQVTNYYIDKFLPVFKKAGDYEKCELAYRFMIFVSLLLQEKRTQNRFALVRILINYCR